MESNNKNTTIRRFLAIAFVLALGVPVVFSLLPGCDSSPSEPVYNNPFDPLGPDGGDPLQVRATAFNDTTVKLTWNQPQGLGITKYVISGSPLRESGWEVIGNQDHTSNPTTDFDYHEAASTSTTWYRVQAFTDTDFSITSYATPDSATTGPRVIVGTGFGHTGTRFTNLEITVTQGNMVRIALDSTFTENLMVVPAEEPGVPLTLTYDIGTAAGNDEIKTLYVASFSDGYESVPSVQSIRVEFEPAFTVVGEPKTLATRTVDLTIPTEGVLNMRFFANEADTATTPWVPVFDTYVGYQLSDSANKQTIFGQFQGDFGFNSLVELSVTPDLLDQAAFFMFHPDSSHTTEQSTVTGFSNAVATEMRYSESADLALAPWVAYKDTVQIGLSPTPGHKVIYVQYRNDWTMSGILTDYVIHVSQPAEVSFWAPLEGDVLMGGTRFQVRGASTAGEENETVFLVKFDPGDGNGFLNAVGTETWTYMWEVPSFTADTQLTIRAQAFYGPSADSLESVTTDITVTVTQLAVTITDPVDGADLTGNMNAKFSGTAAGVLGGATLDSVTIDIGADHLEASGTTSWSADWDAPLWDADTTLTLAATVWAHDDATVTTATTSIQVNVVRPPVAIEEPDPDDLVDSNTEVIISGRTFADLFSAPVDSVVVNISSDEGSETLLATGTDSWEVTWLTPGGLAANLKTKIVAEAFYGAGTGSEADSISVTVKP
jgi:hypothetical protein